MHSEVACRAKREEEKRRRNTERGRLSQSKVDRKVQETAKYRGRGLHGKDRGQKRFGEVRLYGSKHPHRGKAQEQVWRWRQVGKFENPRPTTSRSSRATNSESCVEKRRSWTVEATKFWIWQSKWRIQIRKSLNICASDSDQFKNVKDWNSNGNVGDGIIGPEGLCWSHDKSTSYRSENQRKNCRKRSSQGPGRLHFCFIRVF